MPCKDKEYIVIIEKWPSKVPIGNTPASYYSGTARLPKKHKDIAVLKKFGKKVSWYVNKKTGKKILKKAASVKYWNLNGQALYVGNLHWKVRSKVVQFYHNVFKKQIKKDIKKKLPECLAYAISISTDIYEIYSKFTPDVTNMWLLEKMFEDSLQELGLIQDDSPEFVIESGKKRYYWVQKEEDRKLVFKIKFIKI